MSLMPTPDQKEIDAAIKYIENVDIYNFKVGEVYSIAIIRPLRMNPPKDSTDMIAKEDAISTINFRAVPNGKHRLTWELIEDPK